MLAALTFEFFRFRFNFCSADGIYFAPYQSGNIVRGAFGTIFRSLVCIPGCRDASVCDERTRCIYARVFKPQAPRGGPSGLADWPRPFVFRASHLDGKTIRPGDGFYLDVHIFDVPEPAVEYFILAFEQLAREGLGPNRGRAQLISVDQLDAHGAIVTRIFDARTGDRSAPALPISIDLNTGMETVSRVCVNFLTPTQLKGEQRIAERPEFSILFGRLRDRISTLRMLYGPGPLPIDFRALGERASAVRMVRCELKRTAVERRSSRTGQRHSIGGFMGEVEYEGDLQEFMPYLRIGEWVGVGRQTVWGNGSLAVAIRR